MSRYGVLGLLVLAMMFGGCSKAENDMSSSQPADAKSMEQKVEPIKMIAAKTADQAIELAKKMETVKEKKDYLLTRAESFYKSEDFQQAVKVSQYVIQVLDKDSGKAQELLENAKKQIEAKAQAKVEDVKGALGEMSN